MNRQRYELCRLCTKRLNPVQYRLRPGTDLWDYVVRNTFDPNPFEPDSPLCKKCYRRKHDLMVNANAQVVQNINNIDEVEDDFPFYPAHAGPVANIPVELPCEQPQAYQPAHEFNVLQPFENYREQAQEPVPDIEIQFVNRLPATESECCLCHARSRNRIPTTVRAQAWSYRKIVIPLNNRMCEHHINDNGLLLDNDLEMLVARALLRQISCQELSDYLSECTQVSFNMFTQHLDAPIPRINVLNSDSDCLCYTGLNCANFRDLCSQIYIQEMSDTIKTQAVALFMAKIRMGNSQDQLGHMFGYSQSIVSRYMERASEALDTQFVPRHLGYNHISRQRYVEEHQNSMIRILHEIIPGAGGVLLDGTYFEVEKSSNYGFQKVSFSMQKFYNLVKFMFVVAPDGYILDVFGPTGSDNMHNDASIFGRMLADANGFRNFFQPNDIVIVDRGFRDSIDACEELGLRIAMPPFLNGRRQLEREEADYGRFVTKVRWVIESVNGRVKNVFAFFRHQIPNKYIQKLGRYIRIASAILNAYYPPIYPDREDQIEIARYMVERSRRAAEFHDEIIGLRLNVCNARNYQLTEARNIIDFPRLSEQDLRDLTVGIYQIECARSYTAYHLERTGQNVNEGSEFQLYTHREFSGIVLVKMESRHVQNKRHTAIIAYHPNQNGPNAIHGYYCSCQVGNRMVGMCCHTAALLWLLSYAIPNQQYVPPAANVANNLFNLRL